MHFFGLFMKLYIHDPWEIKCRAFWHHQATWSEKRRVRELDKNQELKEENSTQANNQLIDKWELLIWIPLLLCLDLKNRKKYRFLSLIVALRSLVAKANEVTT